MRSSAHSRGPRPSCRLVTRRRFLASLASASALAAFYAWRIEPHWLEIVRRDLPIEGLPASLDGTTLAHLSDIHIGPRVDPTYLIESFARVQALAPDFVAVTGDWISCHGPAERDRIEHVFAHLPHGRLATVGSLGNHDWGAAWRQFDVADLVTRMAASAGVTVLRNRAEAIAGLQFIGLDDFWSPGFAPEGVLGAAGVRSPSIALSHNPDVADLPVWGSFRGWILAGHTHGGQCRPPFLPPPLLPVRNKRYTCGEFALGHGRRLYVNRGLGHLIRVRFNVRPEVTLFRLAPAAAAR